MAGSNYLSSTDYFVLSTVSLPPHVPSLVAVTGCAPVAVATNATKSTCGASWDPAYGNLNATVLNLAPSNNKAGGLGFQIAQLSPALVDQLGDGGVAQVWFGTSATPPGGSLVASVGAAWVTSPR